MMDSYELTPVQAELQCLGARRRPAWRVKEPGHKRVEVDIMTKTEACTAGMDNNSDCDLEQLTKLVNLPGKFSKGAVHKWREHYYESVLGGMPKSWTINKCDEAEAVKDSRAGHSADEGCNEDETEGTSDGKRPVAVISESFDSEDIQIRLLKRGGDSCGSEGDCEQSDSSVVFITDSSSKSATDCDICGPPSMDVQSSQESTSTDSSAGVSSVQTAQTMSPSRAPTPCSVDFEVDMLVGNWDCENWNC
eukprot:3933250-Rhodomonas_salina.2